MTSVFRFVGRTLLVAAAIISVGCSSQMDQQRELELLADRRAEILSSGLPVNYGSLSIVRAQAKQNRVILEMLYAGDSTLSAQALYQQAEKYYCSNSEILTTLKQGLVYEIRIRNSRGQITVNELISDSTCNPSAAGS
ncbi:hypothetical protein ST37_08945 [Vibrio sp. qd031]|uniref:type II secretion system pilot lipoprotein GspS-beta n=1 Tax=Vibrio sp. qd031 TaxID=1603038 RepID=UPI000A23D712|nr:type II secretion system pilot lipoprotein GspS-beta [Vibrio sp. qd031]ORT50039.1 hypothetical protein ST37_08945 [Vibrio sp. qd031]